MIKPLPETQLKTASELVDLLLKVRKKLEDLELEYDRKRAPWLEDWNKLEGKALAFLNANGMESAKTSLGTLRISRKHSAPLEDPDAFLDYIIKTGEVYLLERRAAVTECREWAEEHGKNPPGVKLRTIQKIGVTKAS